MPHAPWGTHPIEPHVSLPPIQFCCLLSRRFMLVSIFVCKLLVPSTPTTVCKKVVPSSTSVMCGIRGYRQARCGINVWQMSLIQRLQTVGEADGPILTANDKNIGPRSVRACQTECRVAKSWYWPLGDWTCVFFKESICSCALASFIYKAIFYAKGVLLLLKED